MSQSERLLEVFTALRSRVGKVEPMTFRSRGRRWREVVSGLPAALQVIALAALLGSPAANAVEHSPEPASSLNVVLIIPDDHSRHSMGAYGNTQVLTPNLDQLAREGSLFANAYAAAPVCSPSRAAMLTGRYPSQVGVTDFFLRNEHYEERGLDTGSITWPRVLQRNGYTTGLIGKWHIGEARRYHPLNRGFDYFFGYDYAVTPFDPELEVDGKVGVVKGHTSDLFAQAAIDFMSENRDRPFGLVVALREPQVPWSEVPQQDLDAVADIEIDVPSGPGMDSGWVEEQTRMKYASVHTLDRTIGRILKAMDQLQLTSRTVVLYVGDHGMLIGQRGLYGRGAVGVIVGDNVVHPEAVATLADPAITIPFVVRWPGVVHPGSRFDTLVSNVDVFSTVLGMLGVEVPADAHPEGVDLTPLLRSGKRPSRDAVFAQYDMSNFGIAHLRMVRTAGWKLIRHLGMTANAEWLDELYDMTVDPGETRNLIEDDAVQSVREDLYDRLSSWQRAIDDPQQGH